MLSIGRALMAEPECLLLDEPSFGLAPLVVKEIASVIARLNRERGLTILLVEQNTKMAFSLATRAYVLEGGRIVLSGTSAQLAGNPHVREAYLGGSAPRATT
jgi:branched-chain amino acid transport system ATP-binding protein